MPIESSFKRSFHIAPLLDAKKSKITRRQANNIEVRSIPKSGTYLIFSVLKNLGAKFRDCHISATTEAFDQCPDPRICNYKSDFYHTMAKGKNVILVRDPRDNLISMVNWFISGKANYQPILNEQEFKNWQTTGSFESKLNEVINLDSNSPLYARWYLQYHLYKKVCDKYINQPDRFLIIRFEDLVPEELGGAPISTRVQRIKQIFDFFQKPCPEDQKIVQALNSSWGDPNSPSYNSKVTKKVGQWQESFSPKQIQLFKDLWNPILMSLGYEQNEDWDQAYSI